MACRWIWSNTCIFAISICSPVVIAQALQHGELPLSVAISHAKEGDFSDGELAAIVSSHAVEAIPILEKQFDVVPEDKLLIPLKDDLAEALIELHAPSNSYWGYLSSRADEAANCDAPDPLVYDAQGHLIRGELNRALIKWTTEHHVSLDSMILTMTQDFPLRILRLGKTADIRSIPILQRALRSPNGMVQGAAAQALAKLHDNASVPLIIDTMRQSPEDVKLAMGFALMYFDDPRAQKAAEESLPAAVRKAIKDKGPLTEPY